MQGGKRGNGMARAQGVGQRWSMAGRCLTALVGGYAAAAALATLAARSLPVARVEATVWGMILSFLLYALFGLWAFHEPRLVRVAGLIWGTAIAAGGTALLLGIRP